MERAGKRIKILYPKFITTPKNAVFSGFLGHSLFRLMGRVYIYPKSEKEKHLQNLERDMV
jgi:hypothetical protein